MSTRNRNIRWGAAGLGIGLLLMGTAGAWYGDPWYRPYGAGAMTYERQTTMRHHGYAMDDLGKMLFGRHAFDRAEAARLARELEGGFGDELLRNYAPGAVVAGSRTAPWTWRHFGAFQGYATAARQSAGRLAAALEGASSGDTATPTVAWAPPRRFGRAPLGDDRIPVAALQEHGRLNATCYSCHALFRGWRR